MAFKFVILAALVAMVHCSVVPVAQVDTDSSSFSYDVADPNTGDYKSQVETRVGGNVVGQYSLLDADGTKRTVDYTADDVNGFNAVVRKDAAIIASPVVAPAPVAAAPSIVAAEPSIVDARVLASPFVYSGVPSVYSGVPSVYSGVPSVYSGVPSVYSGVRSVYSGVPSVYTGLTVGAPSVYSSAIVPSVYAAGVPYAGPLTYSAYL